MEQIGSLFAWFVETTWQASIVAVLVMGIQTVLRRHIGVRVRQALWLIVLVRLALPVFPDSPVSLFHAGEVMSGMKPAAVVQPSATVQPDLSKALISDGIGQGGGLMPPGIRQSGEPEEQNSGAAVNSASGESGWRSFAFQAASVVWAAGTAVLLLYQFGFALYRRKWERSLSLITDDRLLTILDVCRSQFRIRAPTELYTGSLWSSPHITGMRCIRIYLPDGAISELSDHQLVHVFAHELAHYKRRDLIWNAIGSLVLAVHWMNPLAWFVTGRMKADRELACDAYVLEVLGEAEAVPYGMTILHFLKRFQVKRHYPGLLAFNGSRPFRQLARRMREIQAYKKGSYRLSVPALFVMAVLSVVLLTDAAKPTKADAPGTGIQAPVSGDGNSSQVLFNSPYRSYNTLEKAVKISGLPLKAPGELPGGYTFNDASFELQLNGSLVKEVVLDFQAGSEEGRHGLMLLRASTKGSELKESLAKTDRQVFDVRGMRVSKLTVVDGKFVEKRYIWQDGDMEYRLQVYNDVSEDDALRLIASMKVPDAALYSMYVNNDLFNISLYDTGDLRSVPDSIGFQPKLPLDLPGGYRAVSAMVEHKVNFSYPKDAADRKQRFLSILYERPKPDASHEPSLEFKQIQDGGFLEEVRENGYVDFQRIDGARNEVRAMPVQIGDTQAFKTEAYKIDGPLSLADEADLISYFWKEKNVCYQLLLPAALPQPQQELLVLSLMGQQAAAF